MGKIKQSGYSEKSSSRISSCPIPRTHPTILSPIVKTVGAFLFPNETPLTVEQVCPYLHSNKTVDAAERAYEWCVSWLAVNRNRFDEIHQNGEIWGKLADDQVYVIKDILAKHLHENGFEYNAVIRKWAEKGYVEVNSEGKYTHVVRMLDSRPRCVKLNFNNMQSWGIEIEDKAPEEFLQEEIEFGVTPDMEKV